MVIDLKNIFSSIFACGKHTVATSAMRKSNMTANFIMPLHFDKTMTGSIGHLAGVLI